MLPMQKYRNYLVINFLWLFLPVIAALSLLYIIVSVLYWRGLNSLLYIALSREIFHAVILSIFTSTISSVLALITSLPLAYTLSRYSFGGKTIIESILMLPFAMPPVALGALLLIFFTNTSVGILLNSIFKVVFEVPGLVVAQCIVILPMMIKIVKSSFDLIDEKYDAVARTLGYTGLGILVKVLVPMSKTGISSAFILSFSRALGEFGASVTLSGATRFKTETLPIARYLALNSEELMLTIALIAILIFIAFITLIILHLISKNRVYNSLY